MSITTCIQLIGRPDSLLYSSISNADISVQHKLLKLINMEEKLATEDYFSLTREELQNRCFLLYEMANQQAIKARNQEQIKLWRTWEQIVDILDLACECLETNNNNNYCDLFSNYIGSGFPKPKSQSFSLTSCLLCPQ